MSNLLTHFERPVFVRNAKQIRSIRGKMENEEKAAQSVMLTPL